MIEDIPGILILLFLVLLLAAGPVVFFSFMLGGPIAGFIAIASVVAVFVVLYMLAARSMSNGK